jgi:hypothetical protein
MAAGLGFKDFTTGEVLTAADVDGYLMQGVWVFASAAARDAAVTSPQEGNFAYTKDTNGLWYYDGAAWVASGATGDIEGVTAGTGISGGGTSGTVTITNSMATAIDAKGDLVAGTGADTFSRLAVGANNTVLTADSAEATGLKWATPSSGGMTLISTTTLTGATTTLSSIPQTYNSLFLIISGVTGNTSNNRVRCRPNNSTTLTNVSGVQDSTGAFSVVNQPIRLSEGNTSRSSTDNAWALQIFNYTSSTAFKPLNFAGFYVEETPTDRSINVAGAFRSTTAITSLVFDYGGTNTFASGTVLLYGVK